MKPGRTRVKICGIKRLEDALVAVRQGVDALGFIFYHKSPRYVDLATARVVIEALPPFIDKVGVFVNASTGEIEEAAAIGLTAIQLHGEESPAFCKQLRAMSLCSYIIKAFRVGSNSLAADFSPYNEVVDAFLLDTFVAGAKGGTGEVFDWSIIGNLKLQRPVLLAGGLEPEIIVEAIDSVKPYCLDVNSGVEVAPGVKDHSKVAHLMEVVQKVAVQ